MIRTNNQKNTSYLEDVIESLQNLIIDFIVDHYNRYELIDYVSVIELLEEGYNYNYLSEDLTKEEILNLKEQALNSGYRGFYFDW